MERVFKIGQVAKVAQVNIQTVRYYEKLNLLKPQGRKLSGYRLYDMHAILQLRFIKKAQALGFTLSEIKALLELSVSHSNECNSVRKKATDKISEIEDKIKLLNNMKKTLKELVHCCEKKKKTEKCPILKSLK
ncbi:MAG: MerR family DNA-binding protein [Deltaproteobacteria bacterium]|nr:MerR family DNA-binding protein [Deltaproteobacteria bacterium]